MLVMNTLPMAKPSDLFSDGLLYRFRLRPLNRPTADGQGWRFVPADDEYVFDCVFSAPDPAADGPSRKAPAPPRPGSRSRSA